MSQSGQLDRTFSCILKRALCGFMLMASVSIPPIEEVSGWFTNGQNAAILLNGVDFNNTGYLYAPGDGLFFNHPMNLTTDGTRLLLADTRNNRILIWNTLPSGNVSPDLVLGQDDLTTNNPGTGLNNLNWPVGVSSANGKVVVSDTNNNRVLIWNAFPTVNQQSPDLCLNLQEISDPLGPVSEGWPWGVWTDGSKLIATVTGGGKVFIWNTFPTVSNQPPDLILRGKNPTDGTNRFGTPRTIGTDGTSYLVIGDHNSIESNSMGSFFWKSFPNTDNQSYDFFMANPKDPNQMMWGGEKTSEGRFVAVTPPGISIWNSIPSSASDPPALFVNGYYFNDGDGSHIAITPSGRVYISLYNGNNVVGYYSLPTNASQWPDFVIGSTDLKTNSYRNHTFVDNPAPATDGTSLFVSSDINRSLNVWKSIPTQSGTPPDIIYEFDYEPRDNALFENTFVIAGKHLWAGYQKIQIWTSLPLNGNPPDITFDKSIGSITFQDIQGVALDNRYFYIADNGANKVYIWNVLPEANSSPLFSLDIPYVGKIHSDGRYLAVVRLYDRKIVLYRVDELSSSATPVAEIPNTTQLWRFSLPYGVLLVNNGLFIADTINSRVFAWSSVDDAISGNSPDAVLGQKDLQATSEAIGQNRLFWPWKLASHGNKLWVGEFKFSARVLAFSSTTFSDVPSDYWAYNYIQAIFNAQVTAGCYQEPPMYCPENNVTREEMAVFIIRALDQVPEDGYCGSTPPFSDVAADRWSCKYVKRLVELGITSGIGEGLFGPEDTVTREQMAAFLTRALNEVPADGYCGTEDPFTDVPNSWWSCKYVKRLMELGITSGIGEGLYGPGNPLNRAQMAVFLARAFPGM